ncbi:MAG: anhydro-N-acetylmuramic acid kinase, partial [Pseudomonadota bacterium]
MNSDKTLTAIGLMSGTSVDGIDAAVIRTDGHEKVEWGHAITVPYDAPTRASVIRATKAALEGRDEARDIIDANELVTTAHIKAVKQLLSEADMAKTAIDVIGFHGQTILHRPPMDRSAPGRTW